MILSEWGTKSIGKTLDITEKLFNLSIALSSCMRTRARRLVRSTSSALSCVFPCVNAGIAILPPCAANSSSIRNPQSPSTKSSCSSKSRNPHLCVITLSDTRPPKALDTKEIPPLSVLPRRTLMVLWCLYGDHVVA